jgi:hypothetical protein
MSWRQGIIIVKNKSLKNDHFIVVDVVDGAEVDVDVDDGARFAI